MTIGPGILFDFEEYLNDVCFLVLRVWLVYHLVCLTTTWQGSPLWEIGGFPMFLML